MGRGGSGTSGGELERAVREVADALDQAPRGSFIRDSKENASVVLDRIPRAAAVQCTTRKWRL